MPIFPFIPKYSPIYFHAPKGCRILESIETNGVIDTKWVNFAFLNFDIFIRFSNEYYLKEWVSLKGMKL